MTRTTHHAARSTKLRQTTWALLLVLALTAGLRWVGFRAFPPGLWYDEAYTLVEGQRLSQGGPFQIYYPEKHGEPAIIWLTALALSLGAEIPLSDQSWDWRGYLYLIWDFADGSFFKGW